MDEGNNNQGAYLPYQQAIDFDRLPQAAVRSSTKRDRCGQVAFTTPIGCSTSSLQAGAILPIGAKRFVEDHGQGWRVRHRVRRAERALEGDLARFETGAPGGCDFLASPRGGHRRRPAWSWSWRPGWVQCVSRRRCGPEGLKRWAASGERRVFPYSGTSPCGQAAAPRPGRCLRRAAPSAGRRRPGARRAQRAFKTVEKVLTALHA